jgi:hypothetical protein
MEITHETIAKYFNPKGDIVLIEFMDEVKSTGGVLLEKPEKSLAHPVIAKGENVTKCNVGDWVMVDVDQVGTMKILGKRIAIVKDYQVAMVVDMNYLLKETELREYKRKVAEQLQIKNDNNETPNLRIT